MAVGVVGKPDLVWANIGEFIPIQMDAQLPRGGQDGVMTPRRNVPLCVPALHGGGRDIAKLRGHGPDATEFLENTGQLGSHAQVRFTNHNRTSNVRQSHSLGATTSPKLSRMDSRQIIAALKELRVPHDRIGEALGRDRSAATKMLNGKRSVKANELEPLRALVEEYRGGDASLPTEPPTKPKVKPPPSLGPMHIRGEVAAGAWLDSELIDQREPEVYPASPDPRYPSEHQYLLRVRGDSMNALVNRLGQPAGILNGDLVHVVDAIAISYSLETGDIVVVERSRFSGAEREITLKQVEVGSNGDLTLWPRSTNPKWKDPVLYKEGLSLSRDDEVRVRGKVLNVIRVWA